MSNVLLFLALVAGAVLAVPVLAVILLGFEARRGSLLPDDARAFGFGVSSAPAMVRLDGRDRSARVAQNRDADARARVDG